jgi:eukaryotic-like serine/threonine-protein kinase
MIQEGEFEGFRVEEVLSRSSTTTVYRAFQHSLKRPVLIKELRPELIQEKDVLERFEREAQVCARIKNENIVDLFDYSTRGERIFLVMEYVQGGSLETLIANRSPVPLSLALAIMVQTLRGLAFAHDQGVIHRDLKPGNILISKDGWVKITDFGLSMLEGSPVITRQGAVVGTPAYLAPEAISGGMVTTASDIFSLGVTFYQLLTGQKIFQAEHFSDSLKKVLSFNPPPLAQWRDDVPPELDRLILRMLEKQQAKRWTSATAILEALESQGLLANLGDPKLIIRRSWDDPLDPHTEATPTPSTHYLKARQRKAWLTYSAALVFILLVVGYVVTRQQSRPEVEEIASRKPEPLTKADTLHQSESLLSADSATAVRQKSESQVTTPSVGKGVPVQESQKAEPRPPAGNVEPKSSPVKSPPKEQTKDPTLLTDLRPARLVVQCDPWADVYLDDVFLATTPFEAVQVTPGLHRLTFRHTNFPPVFREINAKPGQAIDLSVNVWETVGRIFVYVDTWAEIFVDGHKKGVTPLQEPLIVSLGSHQIVLKNPSFPTWSKEVSFERDDPPCTLKVELKATHGLPPQIEIPLPRQADSLRLDSNLGAVRGDSVHP